MLKQFMMYPYNIVILGGGLILLVIAVLYLTRARNQQGKEDTKQNKKR